MKKKVKLSELNPSAPTEVALNDINLWEDNPRYIKDKRFESLCKSMESRRQFLFLRPVVIRRKGNVVVCGNMRVRGARHMKWETIPASFIDCTDDEAEELAVLDNGDFGEWDDSFPALLDSMELRGVDLDELGLDEHIQEMVEGIDNQDEEPKEKKKKTCPECGAEL